MHGIVTWLSAVFESLTSTFRALVYVIKHAYATVRAAFCCDDKVAHSADELFTRRAGEFRNLFASIVKPD